MFCVFAYKYKDSILPKILEDISHFMGPLIPLFWTSDDVFSGFQSQSELSYSYNLLAEGIHATFPEIHLWCNTC